MGPLKYLLEKQHKQPSAKLHACRLQVTAAMACLGMHVDIRLAMVLVVRLYSREAQEVEVVTWVQIRLSVRQRFANDKVHHLHRMPLEVQQSVPDQTPCTISRLDKLRRLTDQRPDC